jgi:hypothetical protein
VCELRWVTKWNRTGIRDGRNEPGETTIDSSLDDALAGRSEDGVKDVDHARLTDVLMGEGTISTIAYKQIRSTVDDVPEQREG